MTDINERTIDVLNDLATEHAAHRTTSHDLLTLQDAVMRCAAALMDDEYQPDITDIPRDPVHLARHAAELVYRIEQAR